jgi:hypothetical protein
MTETGYLRSAIKWSALIVVNLLVFLVLAEPLALAFYYARGSFPKAQTVGIQDA